MSEAILRGWGVDARSPGPYPERPDADVGWLDRALAEAWGVIAPRLPGGIPGWSRLHAAIEAEARQLADLRDDRLGEIAAGLRAPLMRHGLRAELVARVFALVREASDRRLGLRHFPVQLMGGFAMLQGLLAEMETGEGKTITAALPAVTAALAGIPVHVVTVNDYLAARDAEALRPLYEMFGLRVGVTRHGEDATARAAAYAADITYATNKDVAFDYLRDRIAVGERRSVASVRLDRLFGRSGGGGRLLLRGLQFAIIDEADSVLIDEARTPLIISGERGDAEAAETFDAALDMAQRLDPEQDYRIVESERRARLTEAGREAVKEAARPLGGVWVSRRAREELAEQALAALHLYERDRQYVVTDDKVQIVDEFTGRIMADRSWERGLHQLIEAKEGCPLTGRRITLARMTYQRFFRRYLRLAGMSGTMMEVAGEMNAVYGLRVARIPTNRPVRRRDLGTRLFRSAGDKERAIVATVQEMAGRQRRPVLIGTRSVAASEQVSVRLAEAGIEHAVLNAKQDAGEASIIAGAGVAGRVVVATNMAGRGTDIRLGPGVAERGGLHVVLTEFHESARIDRQLYGRGGRQGDPGSFEAIVSLDDELFRRHGGALGVIIGAAPGDGEGRLPASAASWLRRQAQGAAERLNSRTRRTTVKMDRNFDRRLAFAGRPE